MTRPIDIACPTCKAEPASGCVSVDDPQMREIITRVTGADPGPKVQVKLNYHHAARVDAAIEAMRAKIWQATPVPAGGTMVPVYQFGRATPRDHGLWVIPDAAQLKVWLLETVDTLESYVIAAAKDPDEAIAERARFNLAKIAELRRMVKP